MHNFWTVLRFELTRTLKKPTFWISILSIPALIGLVFGIVYFSGSSSQAAQEKLQQEPFSFTVLDEGNLVTNLMVDQINGKIVDDKKAAIEQVQDNKIDAFFYYPANLAEDPIEVYNKNEGLIDNSKYTAVAKNIITSAATSAVNSPTIIAATTGSITTNQTNFEDGKEVNPISRIIAPAIFLLTFYALIVLLGNQMLTSTTEEKENRVTEMLLTSLSSRALIVGKIVSLIVLGAVQILAILVPTVLAYVFAREALNIPDISNFLTTVDIELWPTLLGAGLLVSGFLLFTGLLVGIGAAMPTAKEANSFFGFIILLMIVPFWFISLLIVPNDSPVVTGLSYFPLSAPFALMIRNAAGTLPMIEGVIGLAIVTIAGVIAISLAVRIFRFGTLEYGNRISLKTVFGNKKQDNVSQS